MTFPTGGQERALLDQYETNTWGLRGAAVTEIAHRYRAFMDIFESARVESHAV
jgi:hypothetical protein